MTNPDPVGGREAEIERLREGMSQALVALRVRQMVTAERTLAAALRSSGSAAHDLTVANGNANRLRAALADLADKHHRTVVNSKLHDPENQDWRNCPCFTCEAKEAVDVEWSGSAAQNQEERYWVNERDGIKRSPQGEDHEEKT
jgi:hypothetical protein